MRQLNFVIIFVFSLALVLFGIENTEPSIIRVIPGVNIQAPLSVELILAMGIGAVLAWVFSVWNQLQRMLEVGRDLKERDERIEELQQDVQRYKVELEEQRLLPASQEADTVTETAEVYAQ